MPVPGNWSGPSRWRRTGPPAGPGRGPPPTPPAPRRPGRLSSTTTSTATPASANSSITSLTSPPVAAMSLISTTRARPAVGSRAAAARRAEPTSDAEPSTTERTGSSSRPVVRAVSTSGLRPEYHQPHQVIGPGVRQGCRHQFLLAHSGTPIPSRGTGPGSTGRFSAAGEGSAPAGPMPGAPTQPPPSAAPAPTVGGVGPPSISPVPAMYQMPAKPRGTAQSNSGTPKLTGVLSPEAWAGASTVPASGVGRRGVLSGPPTTRASSERPPGRPPTVPTPGWWRSSHR